MKIPSTELEEYIKTTLAAITRGVHADASFRIEGIIEFDVAVTTTKEGQGGFKVFIVSAGSKIKSEKISRIRFKVKPYGDEKPLAVSSK